MRDNDLFQLALGITSPWFVASSAFDAAKRRSRIVSEHRRRQGDPAAGGSTRQPVMTAYRQQALACAAVLSKAPARRGT